MNQPLIVTVDSSKGIAKMSGPLTLGNSYKVGYAGLTEEEARPTERDQETGEVTYQGTQVVLLGIPQLTDEWKTANPETRIAAITDDNDVLALTTTELVEAFKAAPPAPMPPVPPRDPRRPAQPMGMALHGTARPHGAVRLHFYVTAGGATLAQGDCTLNWAPFEFDGAGNPVVLQGPKGDKGEQGEQGPRGERGADAVIYTSTGCITFQVCHDENAVDGNGDSLYGHLIAYADNDYELYHGGDTTKPHFILGTGSGSGGNGMTAGHLFYIYYPADPATAPSSIDLGSVRGPQGPTDSGAVFAATLKSELEQNAGEMAAWNLNTAIHLANAIKNAIFAATGQVTALLLAFVLPFLFGGTAHAQLARTRSARASARGAIIRALRTQQAIHGQWTMIEQSGVIVNTGVDGSDGNLTRTEGATLSTNVPPCNFVDGEPQGHSLAFAAINNVAAAESANEYDPLAGAEAFTICAWVRRTSREGMGTAQRIVSDVDGRTSASGVNGFEFRFSGKAGKLHLRLNGEDITSSTATVAPDDAAWHHVAVSYDGTRSGEGTATGNKHVHFYLDAVQKGNGNVAAMGEVLTNGVPLTLGNSSAGRELSGILNGEMDNVFVIRDWSPAPPGNGLVSTAIDTLMRINDYDDEPGWDPEPDVPGPDHEYDIGEAEPLGDMHPTNTLYTAAQIDALLATVGANADWLEVVGNLASNALPASWADTPYFSGLEVEGGVQAGEFILDGDGIESWSDLTGPLNDRIDSLYVECVGGWAFPDYFTVEGIETGVLQGSITNTATETATVYNVAVDTIASAKLKGWKIDKEIVRQSDWEDEVVWEPVGRRRIHPAPHGHDPNTSSISTNDLVIDGDVVSFATGVESVSNSFAAVRGTLGDYTMELELDFDASKQGTTSTVYRFAGPAADSLLAATWEAVLGTASNGVAQDKTVNLRTWDGYGSGTAHVEAGWDEDFWAAGLGDFSCISYHTDTRSGVDGGVCRPLTLVTPRHALCANHYKPLVGSNVYWVTRSGEIATNTVTAYKTIRGDLAVARLDHAFDTNDIAPAMLLGSGWHGYLYGSRNYPSGLLGVPVLGFDCAERGYVMAWMPTALRRGRAEGVTDDASFSLGGGESSWPFYRAAPVGGDSGSPVFWPIDGTNTVLLGCWHTTAGGPLPSVFEVDAAIADWGDAETVDAYDLVAGGWESPDGPPPMPRIASTQAVEGGE